MYVLGVDLSSRAVDLVRLELDSNRADWVRCELAGGDAWARTLTLRDRLPVRAWFDEVFLVAIEAPYGRGQAGTNAVLNRVVGAVAASLPARLRMPERCWLVRPDEYRTPFGLSDKPGAHDLDRLAPGWSLVSGGEHGGAWSHGRDAYLLAYWAREQLAKASAA